MTKSTGVGRGGPRPGAGRKAKRQEPAAKVATPPVMPGGSFAGLSRQELVEAVLEAMVSGQITAEPARVSACRALLRIVEKNPEAPRVTIDVDAWAGLLQARAQ
jgi:hypothetical protein